MECSLKELRLFDFDDLFNGLIIQLETIESILSYIQVANVDDLRLYPALDGVKMMLDRVRALLNEESEKYALFENQFKEVLSAKSWQEEKALIENMNQKHVEDMTNVNCNHA